MQERAKADQLASTKMEEDWDAKADQLAAWVAEQLRLGELDEILDAIQLTLDIIGLVFDPVDLVNGGISLAHGKYGEAGLSLICVVPVFGDCPGGG